MMNPPISEAAIGLCNLNCNTLDTISRQAGHYQGGEHLGPFIVVGEQEVDITPGFYGLRLNQAYHHAARDLIIRRLQTNDRFFIAPIAVAYDAATAMKQLMAADFESSPVYQMLLHDPTYQETVIQHLLSDYNRQRQALLCQIIRYFIEKDPSFETVLDNHYFSKQQALDMMAGALAHTSKVFEILMANRACCQKVLDKYANEVARTDTLEKLVFSFDHHPPKAGCFITLPLANILLQPHYKVRYQSLARHIGQSLAQRTLFYQGVFEQVKKISTLHQENYRAVCLALAQDLARARGIPVADTQLLRTQYPNGTPKYLTFSTWHEQKTRHAITTPITQTQPATTTTDLSDGNIAGLGHAYVPFITLMALFGKNAEIEILGTRILHCYFAGKALSMKSALKALVADLTLKAPIEHPWLLFKDAPHAHKMAGLYQLQQLRRLPAERDAADLAVIAAYTSAFPQYRKKLNRLKKRLLTLDESLLNQCQTILQWPDWQQTLTARLGLITNPVTSLITANDRLVRLNYLQHSAGYAVTWHLSLHDDWIHCQCQTDLAAVAQKRLTHLLSEVPVTWLNARCFKLPLSASEQALSALSEVKIAEAQGQQLVSMWEEEAMNLEEADYDRLADSHSVVS